MTIDRLEPVPLQDRMYRICFSDGTVLKTYDHVILELGLSAGMTLDEERFSHLQDAAGLASAQNRAVRIIAASGVSARELEHRLVQKGETPEHAGETIRWLEELNLLDDGKTAEQLVRSAVAKGYGKARIKQILYQKQISEEFWEAALALVPEMDDAVDRFLSQRLRGREPDEKEMKRTIDALLRRGHSWQDIRAGLRRYSASLEDELEELPYE